MVFDNHDARIRYYELVLERGNLDGIANISLPEGYRFIFYQPGLASWKQYYEGRESELEGRMVFVENACGEKVATATAFYDIYGRDTSGAGWLHWVAVRREDQGRGLSKPLISHVLNRMRELGYTQAKIPTQTTTWLACRIYLDFGFTPIPANAVHSRDGWRIIKALTGHPSLAEFDAAELEEILEK